MSRRMFMLIALVSSLVLTGCFGGDDVPGARDNPTPGPGTGGTDEPGGSDDNGTTTPPPPAGTPVEDAQTLTISGPGPTGGGTEARSAAYRITPGFTAFTIELKWFEPVNDQELGALGSVRVELVDGEGAPVGSGATLQGPGAGPTTATLTFDDVPEAGDYSLRATVQDPAAKGSLAYTIVVTY